MLILTGTDNEILTANGSAYLVSFNTDGTGSATVDCTDIAGAQVIDQFRFARLTLDFVGGELRATFHGACAVDRNPVEFDRPGARVRMTSKVIDIVPMG